MNAALRCVLDERLADLCRLWPVVKQAWLAPVLLQYRSRSCKHRQPRLKPRGLSPGVADTGELSFLRPWVDSRPFSPTPRSRLCSEKVKSWLSNSSLTCWIKQVVDRPQFISRDPEAKNCGSLAVIPWRTLVGSNLRLCRKELSELVDFVLQKSR